MRVLPRYSHHKHSGRLRPHQETSYALLVFLTLVLGGLLAGWSLGVDAATTGSGSYSVEAVVSGEAPKQPARITSPSTGQTFQVNPITVVGTCPAKTLIKIFKNGILAGSTVCQASGNFTLPIDLLIGKNDLTALAYNANDQAGPDAPAVTVTLNVPSGGIGFSTELIIQSTSYYRGAQPGDEVTWPVELVGGLGPYAVSFDWGDGTSDLLTRTAPGPFTLKHTYKKVGGYLGSYPLIIRATDTAGHTAYLQLTSIINQSTGKAAAGFTPPASPLNKLIVIWPLWIVLLLMIVSFWLGERREKGIMQHQMEALS
jgi:hypothetical protein